MLKFFKSIKEAKELELNYERIEKESNDSALYSSLNSDYVLSLPIDIKRLCNYKVFGFDIFAVPNEIIIKGDNTEYENPFSFLASDKEVISFESEYRPAIPNNFIPFGYLHGGTDVVLLDKKRETVHVFHVSDIADKDSLKRKLNNEICTYIDFIKSIRLQTVTCLINPSNYSEALLLEIREKDKIYFDYSLQSISRELWADYIGICKSYMDKGFKVHYSSKWIKEMLNI